MGPKLFRRYLIWSGQAIDIGLDKEYPANVLSNMSTNAFLFDGILCASMESFLQSLKSQDPARQRCICCKDPRSARLRVAGWLPEWGLWWNGTRLCHTRGTLQALITRAVETLFIQNEDFQTALLTTGTHHLYCSEVKDRGNEPVIGEKELCNILMDVRSRSHLLVLNAFKRQNQFMHDTSLRLVDDTMEILRSIDNGEDIADGNDDADGKRGNIVMERADVRVFPSTYSFGIRLTKHEGLWLTETFVTNGTFKFVEPLAFGTPAKLLSQFADSTVPDYVCQKLLNGVSIIENDGYNLNPTPSNLP